MPAIKKKWIKANLDGGDMPDDDNDDALGDEDRELADGGAEPEKASKPRKRPAQSSPQPGMLRGLDGEVLLEKRKRFVPPAELKLSEWLENNLEKRTEETLHLPHLYNYYTELCQADDSDILDIPEFNRMVKEKFGKTFGIQQSSVYKTLIKERKINKEKKKPGPGIKMKEIVHEAINSFGNPWNGVRFFNLKTYLGTKYPALQIDLKPKVLKRALEMGLRFGQIELVKGVGMAGFYRLPGAEPPPPKEKPKAKKEEDGEKKDGESSGEAKSSGDAQDEAAADGAAENGEKKEKTEGAKKKKKKSKKSAQKVYSKLQHGSPTRIEDILPLAITYQSAPKAASIARIRRYLMEKYGETISDHHWRKIVESGAEKAYWEHVSGSGISGSLLLLMDDFHPLSDKHEDQVCAAIIACHEPKTASANQIKKYISQYHPEFQVDVKPFAFKKALLRATAKNLIMQLSGIGASGSFQLTQPFLPSPSVLAGEDESSDDEEEYDSDAPVYIPRGTKSRGMPKIKTYEVAHSPSRKTGKSKGQKKSGAKTGKGGRGRTASSYAESSSEDEDEAPEVKKSKNKKTVPKGKEKKAGKGQSASKKRARSPSSSEEDEAVSEDEPEYTPRKSQSRGGPTPKSGKPAKQVEKKAAKPGKKSPKPTKAVEPKDKTPVSTPAKKEDKKLTPASDKKSKGGKSALSKSPGRPASKPSPAKKQKLADSDDGDEESGPEIEYTPRKSKSRGGGGGGGGSVSKAGSKESSGRKGSRGRK